MSETTHPVDLALRTLTTTIEPNRADFEYARVKLMETIAAETGPRSQRRMRLSWATAIVLVAASAVFLVETASTSPAEALITEIAQVVEAQQPLVIGSEQFAYTRTETTVLALIPAEALGGLEIQNKELAYRVPQTREVWIGDDGTVRVRTISHSPLFFSPADETAYYAAGRPSRQDR